MGLPRIGLIATGGTISAVGRGPLDIIDYGANNTMVHVEALLERIPEARLVADIVPVPFDNVPSYHIDFPAWQKLAAIAADLAQSGVAGIVITHGTASLEETAFFLNLTLKLDVPVVVVGSQRPVSALSTDAELNLVNALRVAGDPAAQGRGVMVMLNDEIHSARDVTKTSTFRLQTFKSPDYGPIGYADADRVHFARMPEQPHTTTTEFDVAQLSELPRVDISYSYVGMDGTAVRAFHAAGARGIVAAGFPPGLLNQPEVEALAAAAADGVIIVQGSRGGSGRALAGTRLAELGFVPGEAFNPQKARLLLQLALTITHDRAEIARIFATY